jgi:transcriptional regulator with XRE-family HTH domain
VKRGWPHVDSPEGVGRRLKDARLEAGMSQRELAFPGCTAVYICRIERGDRVPSLQVLRELARRLDVDEDYLATGSARADDVVVLAERAAELLVRRDHAFISALYWKIAELLESEGHGYRAPATELLLKQSA